MPVRQGAPGRVLAFGCGPHQPSASSLTASPPLARFFAGDELRKDGGCRWVVEVAHSWFNRFRKLLVRYEKLDRSFMALNHLAASIMAFRKIKLDVNIIYG